MLSVFVLILFSVFVCVVVLFVLETGSSCIALAGLELTMSIRLASTHRDLHASASQVLGLKV